MPTTITIPLQNIGAIFLIRPVYPNDLMGVTLESILQRDNTILWAIRWGDSACLNKNAEWEVEPGALGRTDEWIAQHRWDNFLEALSFARQNLINVDDQVEYSL